MGKVIDINERLKLRGSKLTSNQNHNHLQNHTNVLNSDPSVAPVDMTEARKKIIQADQRAAKRVILNGLFGVHAVVPGKGLLRVSLHDLSNTGLAFDVDVESGEFNEGEEIAMRLYLNHEAYIPFMAKVRNVRLDEVEGVYRHGVRFLPNTMNHEALGHFVNFIENVSASLRTDKGDMLISGFGG